MSKISILKFYKFYLYLKNLECPPPDAVPEPQTTKTPGNKTQVNCDWSQWLNGDSPLSGSGDLETISDIKNKFGICPDIVDIECRVAGTLTLFSQAGQDRLMCDALNGFRCYNSEQSNGQCLDYEVRVLCWGQQCPGLCTTILGQFL